MYFYHIKDLSKVYLTIAFNKATLVKETNSLLTYFIDCLVVRFLLYNQKASTGSLEPTISSGDFILVNQFKYGLRVPVIHNKILEVDKPERGELFYLDSTDPNITLVKINRLPGDHIHIKITLYVNGEKIKTILKK